MYKTLYITGSFPRLGDGIGDAAGKLYDAVMDKDSVTLMTSAEECIKTYIDEKKYNNVILVKNWTTKTLFFILKLIRGHKIERVIIEYAGNGYKRDLAISFLPFWIRFLNIFHKKKIICHLRLHEFSMCRLARKLFTYPLVWFSHEIDTPSYVEYEILQHKYGSKVMKSGIGSNFNWLDDRKKTINLIDDRIHLGYFGGVYPGKGIETLLGIWGQLEKMYPNRYEYYLLGGFPKGLTTAFDGYQKTVQELIDSKGLKDKIHVTGFLEEAMIEKELDKIDIAVLPYEDGLTLRRGSFLAFLGRQVAVVTSSGDDEAKSLFAGAVGVRMCGNDSDYIKALEELSNNKAYIECGQDNARFKTYFDWQQIAERIFER